MLPFSLLIIALLCNNSHQINHPFSVYLPPENTPPIYYTDEILPICITGPPNSSFDLQVIIKNSASELIHEFTPEKPTIQSNSIYCCSITDLPPLRGYFLAEIKISNKDYQQSWTIPFCKIERFTPQNRSLFAIIDPKPKILPLLKLLWFDEVVFSAESPQLQNLIQNAITEGFEISIKFDPDKFTSPTDTLEHIFDQIGPYVNKWDFKPIKDKSLLTEIITLIEKNSKTAKISLSIDNSEYLPDLENLISNTDHIEINWCGKLNINDLQNLIDALIKTRCEYPNISISLANSNFQYNTQEQLQKIWELLTLTPSRIKLSSDLLFQNEHPTPLIPSIITISKLWQSNFEFIGWFKNEPSLKAPVFSSPQNWLLVLWGNQTLTLKGDALATTQGFDLFSNPIPLPSISNGSLNIEPHPQITYLTGSSYNVVIESAQNNIKNISEKILSPELAALLPLSISESIKSISQNPNDTQNRVRLLSIFRLLPELERNIITNKNWNTHSSLLTHYLYDFLRKSCILEQSKPDPFREPFLDIKTRCEEYITNFLTGTSTNLENDKRANFVMKEINKILELADETSSNGKRIEASALLYFAEGMALSLIEHLKVTPLMLAEDKIPKPNTSTTQNLPHTKSTPIPTPQTPQPSPSSEEDTYTVVAGDTIEKIAKKLGTTKKELLLTNNLSEKSILRIGQKLKIPSKQKEPTTTTQTQTQPTPTTPISSPPKQKEKNQTSKPTSQPQSTVEKTKEPPNQTEVIVYKVQPGDIPATIAKKFGLTTEELMNFNNITDPTKLHIGQELKIPNPKTKPDPPQKTSPREESKNDKEKTKDEENKETTAQQPESENIIHIVQKGENPYTIGKKYGLTEEEILKANNLTPKSLLQIGQKLIIPKPKKKQ